MTQAQYITLPASTLDKAGVLTQTYAQIQPTIFFRRHLYRLIKLNYVSMFNSKKGGQI